MNALRKIAAGSLAAVLACSMAACGSGNANSTDSASNTGKTVKVDEKSAKATSISDFGGMDGLVAAAEKEGALNVIALPHDWSNYGDVISGFKKKYPKIKINEQNPNASSKEEVDAGKTNKGTDAAPDVYDLGLAVASTSTDNFASYKVQAWDKIPDSVKDKDGKYIMQPDPTDATKTLLFGKYPVKVVSNKTLKSTNVLKGGTGSDKNDVTGYKYPVYMGDLKEAVTLFNKKGTEVEQEREGNIRRNTVYSRKYYLAAMTNEAKAVKIITGSAAVTADTTVSSDKTYYAASGIGYVKVTPGSGDNPKTKGWYEITAA